MQMTNTMEFSRVLKLFSAEMSLDEKVYWLLRISVALCFIGHGAFGFIIDDGKMGKTAWLVFYKPFGLDPEVVYKFLLIPLVGVVDMLVAFAVLFVPLRCVWAWAAFWCVFTALLRPLTGRVSPNFLKEEGITARRWL